MWNFKFLVYVALFSPYFIASIEGYKFKNIETNYGWIRGLQKQTLLKNQDYYAFRGIPYAKSPEKELRFKVGVIHFSFNMA